MSTTTTVVNNTLGDKAVEIVVTPNVVEGSALPSLDSLFGSIINIKKETGSSFVEAMDKYTADVTTSHVEAETVVDSSLCDRPKRSYSTMVDAGSPVIQRSTGIRIDRSLLDEEYGEDETNHLLGAYTSVEEASHIEEDSLPRPLSDSHDSNYVASSSLLGDNSDIDYDDRVELQKAIERSFCDLNYSGGFTGVSSFDISHVKLPSYGWYGSNSAANTDCTLQQNRRKLRKSFANTNQQDALFRFLKFLLVKAHERELTTGEFDEERNFVFVPYYPNSYWYNGGVDEFSSKSQSKKIGIKTTLDKYHANLILSVFYILYSKFELTTDENIFEKEYRDGVLMRDDAFELFKFFDRVIMKYPEDVDSLSSLVNSCLDIFNHFEDGTVRTSFFGDDDIQYQVWLLTFSNQVKEVKVSGSSNASFYTISDLIAMYDDEWYASLSTKTQISAESLLNTIMTTQPSAKVEDTVDSAEKSDIAILDSSAVVDPVEKSNNAVISNSTDVASMDIDESTTQFSPSGVVAMSPIHAKVEPFQINHIPSGRTELMSPTRGVISVASTPVKKGKKSNSLVDGVLSNLFSFLKIKND